MAARYLAVLALVTAGLFVAPAVTAQDPGSKPAALVVRYVLFVGVPKPDGPRKDWSHTVPPAITELNSGISYTLGRDPKPFLRLMQERLPDFRVSLALSGEVKFRSDQPGVIQAGPNRTDPFRGTVSEEIRATSLEKGAWRLQARGHVQFTVQAPTGPVTPYWSWDGEQTRVNEGHTQAIGAISSRTGQQFVYARCLLEDGH